MRVQLSQNLADAAVIVGDDGSAETEGFQYSTSERFGFAGERQHNVGNGVNVTNIAAVPRKYDVIIKFALSDCLVKRLSVGLSLGVLAADHQSDDVGVLSS